MQRLALSKPAAAVAAVAAAMALIGLAAQPGAVRGLSAAAAPLKQVAQLAQSTQQVYQNTKTLSSGVQSVALQLQQLDRQEQILQQTGQSLEAALATQADLTAQGVSWMRDILERQRQTQALTHQVAGTAQAMAPAVSDNASGMMSLEAALRDASNSSAALNGQLDALLRELASAQQEFRLFGQLQQLLPIGVSGPQSGLGGVTGAVRSAVGSVLNALP
ncbi:hypothetical protein [Alicyclobacillus macrosporangiidus]|uniref:hypothetical protein n=1 Tax=Alicyclobacillus macrosporangiidus TaxID=392015 RepID=UPI000555DF54|nr:hypothetical protein [Alicyclobacillus macrosporangiidus]